MPEAALPSPVPALSLMELVLRLGRYEYSLAPGFPEVKAADIDPPAGREWNAEHLLFVFRRLSSIAASGPIQVSIRDCQAQEPRFLYCYQDGWLALIGPQAFVFAADEDSHLYGGPDPQSQKLSPEQRDRCSAMVSGLSREFGGLVAAWYPRAQRLALVGIASQEITQAIEFPAKARPLARSQRLRLLDLLAEQRRLALVESNLSEEQAMQLAAWEREWFDEPIDIARNVTRGTYRPG